MPPITYNNLHLLDNLTSNKIRFGTVPAQFVPLFLNCFFQTLYIVLLAKYTINSANNYRPKVIN